MTSILTIVAYCACLQCCGKTDGITASGARVTSGVTAAMNGVPFGTQLKIDGVGTRIVQDRMARRFGPTHIDLYFPSHKQAREFGRRRLRVTVITP